MTDFLPNGGLQKVILARRISTDSLSRPFAQAIFKARSLACKLASLFLIAMTTFILSLSMATCQKASFNILNVIWFQSAVLQPLNL